MGKVVVRLEQWEARLNHYFETAGPFAWGTNDCCMFAVGAVKAITGVDHGIEYRHKTAKGAARLLKAHGGVEAIATKHLGPPKAPLFAQRGDVVSFNTGHGMSLGICVGHKMIAVSKDGLVSLPMSQAHNVWSV